MSDASDLSVVLVLHRPHNLTRNVYKYLLVYCHLAPLVMSKSVHESAKKGVQILIPARHTTPRCLLQSKRVLDLRKETKRWL